MGIRILLIDDSEMMRRKVKNTLKSTSVDIDEVLESEDGGRALKLLGKIDPPDLIFCDYHMPGINGLEFLKRVQKDEKTQNIPVIILTSEATVERMKETKAAGAKGFIRKPFEAEKFEKMFEMLFGGKS